MAESTLPTLCFSTRPQKQEHILTNCLQSIQGRSDSLLVKYKGINTVLQQYGSVLATSMWVDVLGVSVDSDFLRDGK